MFTDIPSSIRFVTGSADLMKEMLEYREHFPVFSREACELLSLWASEIRSLPRAELTSALSAFAFWCRPNSLNEMRGQYANTEQLTGRGICLQFVPSNIASLFAYSMAAALLAGNSVIIRLSDRLGGETESFIKTLEKVLEGKPEWKRRISLIRYGHEKAVTDWLSAQCDTRVIWGGDRSVAEIQESPSSGNDIVFPNRRSMAVISAGAVLEEKDIEDTIRNFYNDTYLTDQNACSSPGIVCWLGNSSTIKQAKGKFWKAMASYLEGRYEIGADMAVLKLEQAMVMSAEGYAGNILSTSDEMLSPDNRIIRVQTGEALPALWDYTMPCGFFIEVDAEEINEIQPLLVPVCQTISYFGIPEEEIRKAAAQCGSFMTAPMGHTLDFSLNWDGHDLIREMSCIETQQ